MHHKVRFNHKCISEKTKQLHKPVNEFSCFSASFLLASNVFSCSTDTEKHSIKAKVENTETKT